MINTITTPMRNMYHKKETVEETRKISKASFLVCDDNEEKETQKRRGGQMNQEMYVNVNVLWKYETQSLFYC